MSRLTIFCACATALLSLPGCSPPETAAAPTAQDGTLDARTWDFSGRRPIVLSGSWRFFWQELLAPREVDRATERGATLPAPGSWAGQKIGGQALPGRGFGTYRLTVLLPPEAPPLSLKQMPVDTAYVLFVNGKKRAANGTVGRDEASSRPQWVPQIVDLGPMATRLELVLWVSNHELPNGGPFYGTTLGSTEQVRAARERGLLRDAVLAGVLLLFGFYHLSVFAMRRVDHSAGYFGLASVSAAVHAVTHGEKLLFAAFPDAPFELLQKVNVLGGYLVLPLWIGFLQNAFPDQFWKRATRTIQIVALFFVAAVLLLPARLHFQTGLPYYVLNLAAFLFAAGVLVRALYRRTEGSALVLVGVLAILAALLHDFFFELGRLPGSVPLFSAGIFLFFFVQSVALARLFSGAFLRIEGLSGELESRNKELRRLDELKDEFLANTSHELRTPLNGIIGITESLLEGATGALADDTRRNLQLVSAGGRRLASLVNDILDFSRLQYRDIVLRSRAFDISSAIDLVLQLSAPLVGPRRLELLHKRTQIPPVFADEERVQQILHNLIGNAIKFTKAGLVVVSCRTRNGMLEVTVADTGIGIPKDKQSVIFESFAQADGSVAREYGGTGLGLSITKQLVELHGGTLIVESTPGEGARFTFSLPIADGEPQDMESAEDHPSEAVLELAGEHRPQDNAFVDTRQHATARPTAGAAANPESRTEGHGRGMQVLIVDDDPVNLQVLRNHLSLHDYTIIEALSGAEALRLIQERPPPDVALIDVMMPGLSGYEMCRILRETYSASELPVIMLTARSRAEDLVIGLESGANDYIAKPFEPSELLARVRTLIRLKHSARDQSDLASLQKELVLAREIQQSLLPGAVPVVPGLEVAMRYRAMENVGGDFFDFRTTDAGQLAVLMADVSGHGVPAALIVSIVKVAFWFQERHLALPTSLFTEMNRILLGNSGNEFVTACYAFLDLAEGNLTVGNAGHPPILVCKSKDRQVLSLRPFGRLLGILPDGGYQAETVQVSSGDRILLYTDGVFEASNEAAEQFGEERLRDFLRDHPHLTADEFATELVDRVTAWSGGEAAIGDDIALVVIDLT